MQFTQLVGRDMDVFFLLIYIYIFYDELLSSMLREAETLGLIKGIHIFNRAP